VVYPPFRRQTVTHPSINRAQRRATTLIETNALPLNHAKKLSIGLRPVYFSQLINNGRNYINKT